MLPSSCPSSDGLKIFAEEKARSQTDEESRDSSLNEKNSHLSLPLQASFAESEAVPCKGQAIPNLTTGRVLKLFSGSP